MYKGNFKLMLHEFRPLAAFRLSWEEYDCIGKEIFISLLTIIYLTRKEKQFPFFLINNFKKYSYHRLWIFSGFYSKAWFIYFCCAQHTCTHTHMYTRTHKRTLTYIEFVSFSFVSSSFQWEKGFQRFHFGSVVYCIHIMEIKRDNE